jgi:hypothetical protein
MGLAIHSIDSFDSTSELWDRLLFYPVRVCPTNRRLSVPLAVLVLAGLVVTYASLRRATLVVERVSV